MRTKVNHLFSFFLLVTSFAFFSCGTGDSQPLATVPVVNLEKYMGTWYEIARFPHRFEKDLTCVTATYTLKESGKVTVLNKGFNAEKGKNKTAEGTAWVPDDSYPGRLKVRFFWPFAGDYYILDLDEDYSRVLVGAPDREYLWILSRTDQLNQETYDALVKKASSLGFDVSKLQKVPHDCPL